MSVPPQLQSRERRCDSKDLAGKPEPFLGLGQLATISAPLGGEPCAVTQSSTSARVDPILPVRAFFDIGGAGHSWRGAKKTSASLLPSPGLISV